LNGTPEDRRGFSIINEFIGIDMEEEGIKEEI
jgi:hypothetical protein